MTADRDLTDIELVYLRGAAAGAYMALRPTVGEHATPLAEAIAGTLAQYVRRGKIDLHDTSTPAGGE